MKCRLIFLPLLVFIGVGALVAVAAWRADGAGGPWDVSVESHTFTGPGGYKSDKSYRVGFKGDWWIFECGESGKEACYDFVDAMNAAHERRTQPQGGHITLTAPVIFTNDPGSGLRPEK